MLEEIAGGIEVRSMKMTAFQVIYRQGSLVVLMTALRNRHFEKLSFVLHFRPMAVWCLL